MNESDCDIVVVGGGIVGTATALALQGCGFDTRVIEAGPRPAAHTSGAHDPRVYAIAPHSARLLSRLGLWNQIVGTRAQGIRQMRVWERAAESALCFDAAETGAPALGWIVEHRLLLDRLWSQLDASRALTGTEVRRARFDDDAVSLELSSGQTLRTALVIAAEGAHSPLRQAAGIGTQGWAYGSTAIVCHVDCSTPHHGTALQRFLPTGPLALLPLSDGRRSLVWSTSTTDAAELMKLPDATFARLLETEMQGAAGEMGALTARVGFELRLMHAERYVAPRFALVGDSAHVIHPLAGQGLNLGLADAEALVDELRGARDAGRAWAAPRTLARYERARQDANLEMMALTDGLHRAFGSSSPALRSLLGRGLEWVGQLPPVKRGLMARAQG